jgi:Fe2+ or Zn2+ uptake regulation protein
LQKERNLRMTRQRQVILEELRKVCSHPSADEIYAMVRKRLPRISLGTVYRNLEILSELGEIQKLESAGTLKRFDGNPHAHYHVRCMECNRVEDTPVTPISSLEEIIRDHTDFKIMGHNMEFVGLCPDCEKRGRN